MEKDINTNPKLLFKIFLITYIFGGVTATILSLIYNYNKEYVGIAFLIGALVPLYFYLNSNSLEIGQDNFQYNKFQTNLSHIFKLSIIFYCILCILLLQIFLSSLEQYYLPLKFFIVIFFISAIILSQILLYQKLDNTSEKIILFEILFLNIIVFSSFIFLFPSPYGNDSHYHVEFIRSSINAGYLIGEGLYENYPIFHLLFVFIIEVCRIEDFKLIQLILLFVMSFVLIIWFLLAKKIFNRKIGLISILLISFSPYISQSKFFYFPSSFAAVFFIIILFFIFFKEKSSLSYSLLFIIVLMSLVFVHPMVPLITCFAFFLILLMSKFQISSKFKLAKEKITLNVIVLFLITTVGWWMKPSDITASDLFTYSILSVQKAIEKSDYYAVGSATLAPLMNKWTIISSDLGFILLIVLSIIGSLFILSKTKSKNYSKNSNVIYLAVIMLIFIPIPYMLTIIYPQSLPNRWFPFIEVIASLFAGCSVYLFSKLLNKNRYNFVLILSVAGLVFLLISNPVINPNSQLYAKELSTRAAFTMPELNASVFIHQYTDIEQLKGNSKFISNVIPNSTMKQYVNPEKPDTYNSGLIVLRQYDLKKGFTIPLFGANKKLLDIIYPNEEFYKYINSTNEIYDNGDLYIYSAL